MYPDLQRFVEALDLAGELVRIDDPVDPVLEVSQITDLVSKATAARPGSASSRREDPAWFDRGGHALLFTNVTGSDFPLLINAYGSYRRMEMALGCGEGGFAQIADRIGALVKPEPPRSLAEAVAKARQFAPLLKIGPKRGKAALCQEVVLTGGEIDLTRLPIIRCWPHDGDYEAVGYPAGVNDGVPGLGHPEISRTEWDARLRGRYITLAGIHTVHADDADDPKPKSHNIGMYRVQLLGKDRLAMHWHMHHDGASHWRSWKRRGKPMPVAIVLGGESVLPYAATCPLPPGISELLMAGFLNGGGVRLARGKTVPVSVPANAEIVIEGYVSHEAGMPGWDPREEDAGPLGEGAVFEGPFGDHTGFYSMPDRYPVLKVTAVTHRLNAVYPTTIVGLPPQEDYYLGKATERVMLPLLKTIVPDITDYDLPMYGAFHNCAAIRIDKHYPLHARKVMHAVWGAGQMAWTKTVFVVSGDVDPHDAGAVLRAAATYCRPPRDLETVNGPLDILDHASPRFGAGTKVGFDCTPKVPGEDIGGSVIEAPNEPLSASDAGEVLEAVADIDGVLEASISPHAPGWLLVRVDRDYDEPEHAGLGRRVAQAVSDLVFEASKLHTPIAAQARRARFAVVLGRRVRLNDAVEPLFCWLANSDAGRDMIVRGSFAAWDATPKTLNESGKLGNAEPVRPWPPMLEMDEATKSSVARAWGDRLPGA